MPFLTGLLFALPLIVSVFLLDKVPSPTRQDVDQRVERLPMSAKARWDFFRKFSAPLVLLILAYMILTVFRDFRDNFSAEMWQTIGHGDSPKIFTITEVPIALGVLMIMSLVMFIKNNKTALFVNHFIIFFGLLVVGASTLALELKYIDGTFWMILVGMGLYLGYVPFNSIFFDRMIASFRYVANVGFLIYLADSFGYLASVAVLFYKNFGHPDMIWMDFFVAGAYLLSFIGMAMIVLSMIFFQFKFLALSKSKKDITLSYQNQG
jgi:hypothetical protein